MIYYLDIEKSKFRFFPLAMAVLTLLFLFPSFVQGKWSRINAINKYNWYVDYSRIRQDDKFSYYWVLVDKSKLDENELENDEYQGFISKSFVANYQADCKLLRTKVLSYIGYGDYMGKGKAFNFEIEDFLKEWRFPVPQSIDEEILNRICNFRN
tara:strand:- start:242 stop:703 length:462 start_codon:yes stop_codon:yes gene_type:complete